MKMNNKSLRDRHKRVLKVLSDYAQTYNLEKILDVGCGGGDFSLALKKTLNAKEVYGIDISEARVNSANKKGVKAFRRDVDKDNFPFEDNHFNAVFSLELIEHLYDPDHFLDEVYRVLKPEGIFLLSTPNLSSIYSRIALLLGFQPFATMVSLRHPGIGMIMWEDKTLVPEDHPRISAHTRVFTLRALKRFLKLHFFKIIAVKGEPASDAARSKKFIQIIDDFITMFPSLSEGVICICQKGKTF